MLLIKAITVITSSVISAFNSHTVNAYSSGVSNFTMSLTNSIASLPLQPDMTQSNMTTQSPLNSSRVLQVPSAASPSLWPTKKPSSAQGPIAVSSLAPPVDLSTILLGCGGDATVALQYVINYNLSLLLQYIRSVNLGPTRGSHLFYRWATTLVGAWNWVSHDRRIMGTVDKWNWSAVSTTPLSNTDTILWLCSVMDHVTPLLIPLPYESIFVYDPTYAANVRQSGEWDKWQAAWMTWSRFRTEDGSNSTAQPVGSANWNHTIVVDGNTKSSIAMFPQPQKWTRLTVNGLKQNYLTHSWNSVISTCLSEDDEVGIQGLVAPAVGVARNAEVDSVKTFTENLSDAEKIQAEFWAGGSGELAPPLMFAWLWKEYIRSLPGISPTTVMYSLQDLAVHLFEGSRVTWRLKALHMEARPIQEIRRRYAGQLVKSWNGIVDGAQWVPFQKQNFVTPPFADFPSGHSHFSKAFSLTMTKWFGEAITPISITYDQQPLISLLFTANMAGTYGTFMVEAGASKIELGVPSAPVTLSFKSWEDIATSAGISRLYGGIHALSAHQASQTVAIVVDRIIHKTWGVLTDASFVPLITTSPRISSSKIPTSSPSACLSKTAPTSLPSKRISSKPTTHTPSKKPSVKPITPSPSTKPSMKPTTPSPSKKPSIKPATPLPSAKPTIAKESASFDAYLTVPRCVNIGISCYSGSLLSGRGNLGPAEGGNAPNTLDTCTDGALGSYNNDESVESIKISSINGGLLKVGEKAEIEAVVIAYSATDNYADFYHTANPTNPSWIYIGTSQPSGPGLQSIKLQFTLPFGSVQAVRVIFRYQSSAKSCPSGDYDDVDDIAFAVSSSSSPPTSKPVSKPPTMKPTLMPTSKPPTTQPTTLAPTTYSPTSLAPTTYSPISVAPTTYPPTSMAPTTSAPTSMEPTTYSPTSAAPTYEPTSEPTSKPTTNPTHKPTSKPTGKPTVKLTFNPTHNPTAIPTLKPFNITQKPTQKPLLSSISQPTIKPTHKPSGKPTHKPTGKPTAKPADIFMF